MGVSLNAFFHGMFHIQKKTAIGYPHFRKSPYYWWTNIWYWSTLKPTSNQCFFLGLAHFRAHVQSYAANLQVTNIHKFDKPSILAVQCWILVSWGGPWMGYLAMSCTGILDGMPLWVLWKCATLETSWTCFFGDIQKPWMLIVWVASEAWYYELLCLSENARRIQVSCSSFKHLESLESAKPHFAGAQNMMKVVGPQQFTDIFRRTDLTSLDFWGRLTTLKDCDRLASWSLNMFQEERALSSWWAYLWFARLSTRPPWMSMAISYLFLIGFGPIYSLVLDQKKTWMWSPSVTHQPRSIQNAIMAGAPVARKPRSVSRRCPFKTGHWDRKKPALAWVQCPCFPEDETRLNVESQGCPKENDINLWWICGFPGRHHK